ncbi:DUF1456 family protein [Amphritea sp. 1_MG-2023]|uniref:DUF1456 family protein n=1 Tax=Amphritea sp. 1_MG-2023 TaxID=3062670 RepID=UPI0034A210D8
MTNNDILRRLRYTLDFSDTKMIAVFRHAELPVTRVQLSSWLKKEEDADYVRITDQEMATFLNGLIIEKRGRQEGEQPKPEKQLNNNIIFRKLKIALNFTADDILHVLQLAGVNLSKHELSALFRKQGHQNYRECKDQVLRNFLTGLQRQYREKAPAINTDKPQRKTATAAGTSAKPVRKPADRRVGKDVQFVVDKPASPKPAAKPSRQSTTDTDSVWAKALAKRSKKS